MPKIFKKPLFWVQKALDVIGVKTALPDHVDELVRPQIDALGWDRLKNLVKTTTSNPASTTVASAACPEGVTRLICYAGTMHADTGVNHNPQFFLRRAGSAAPDVAIGSDRRIISPAEVAAMRRPVLLTPGDRLVVTYAVAVTLGSVTLQTLHVDLAHPAGEYIPFLP